MELCIICLRKLQSNIKFDILERYERLRIFFEAQKDERAGKVLTFLDKAIENIRKNIK